MSERRIERTTSALARLGFAETERALGHIASWPEAWDPLIRLAAESADPDLALEGLARIAEHSDALDALLDRPGRAVQAVAVLAESLALNQHLVSVPHDLDAFADEPSLPEPQELRRDLLLAVGALEEPIPVACAAPPPSAPGEHAAPPERPDRAADRLRVAYRRALLRIAGYDLTRPEPLAELEVVARCLADLADATLEAALAIARAEVGPESRLCRLAVIGLGKCGARELNYVSDVDVLFVVEPALDEAGAEVISTDRAIAIGTRLAAALSRVCSAHSVAGTIWQVDAALRPEGKAGALVRSLASMSGYYAKWAKAWEFQAMLKARPVAGDRALGGEFVDLVMPHVWRVGERDGFVADTQAMRRRVISLIPSRDQSREIKLGEGGLRDVEFSVQLLQLVHGRVDERLRTGSTFAGLSALIAGGYVGRADGAEFAEAYRLERAIEHRVQLYRLRRTHLMPNDPAELRRIARSLGYRDAEQLAEAWRSATRRVLSLHRRLFYSPLLAAVARIPSEGIQLTTEAAQDRLRGLGYRDPRAALQHLEALSLGMSRQAEIRRQLLPAMLGWFAQAPNPDHGLLAFRQVSEALGDSTWYLRALRDEGAMAQRLAQVLASSRYLVELLRRSPATVALLASVDDLQPRGREELLERMRSSARRHAEPQAAVEAVRAVRRHELFRIGVGDLLESSDVDQVGRALSDLTSATVEAALEVVRRGDQPDARRPAMAVIAMGRWGGGELSYASDVDAMFVLADDADESEQQAALKAVAQLRTLLARPGPDPALAVDADLRPEGRGGPMVRTLGSYLAYYRRWSSTWESQALLRADHGAGDPELSARLLAAVDPLRYPPDGLRPAQVTEIRKLKARMEAERLPRGGDRKRHLKLGPGGLSDVEWTVQLLQLEHAAALPGLRTTSTLPALRQLTDAGLIDARDAEALRTVWRLGSRIRNRIMLVRGRAADALPADEHDGAALAQLMGYGRHGTSHLLADYSRTARQAHRVVERLFWGLD